MGMLWYGEFLINDYSEERLIIYYNNHVEINLYEAVTRCYLQPFICVFVDYVYISL